MEKSVIAMDYAISISTGMLYYKIMFLRMWETLLHHSSFFPLSAAYFPACVLIFLLEALRIFLLSEILNFVICLIFP